MRLEEQINHQVKAILCVRACSIWHTLGLIADKVSKELLPSSHGGYTPNPEQMSTLSIFQSFIGLRLAQERNCGTLSALRRGPPTSIGLH